MANRYIPFDINDWVRVKLTEHGKHLLIEQHQILWGDMEKKYPYIPPAEDAEGWSRWQLWILMAAFGASITMTGPLPFAAEIEFEVRG